MNERSGGLSPTMAGGALQGRDAPELLRDELLGEIFAATVAARPEAPCIRTLDGGFTYAETDARATAIARGLLAHGVGPGDIVGVWAPRGPETVVGLLAIAKTGAAWLPFDAEAPVERIALCLKDADARLLLACRDFAARAPALPCPTLVLSEIARRNDDPIPTPRELGARPEHRAFVIYTSGSTGTPKGVPITNRNICHYLRAANEIYGVRETDVVFQGASAAFDMSVEETWLAWLAGAALFVATPQIVAETEALPDALARAGVTVLDAASTLLQALPRDVPTLRLIILGGEACPPALAERWARAGRRILNTYGPTETTVVATVAELQPSEAVTIGRPLSNYSCYVVDDALRPAPPGAEGELLIGGPGVAPGYLGRDALTAEKFIVNPFCADGLDPVLYRSGDAVRIDEKGDLVFRGRIDDQVKIRGFRVELGEIEHALLRQRRVRQAAVALRDVAGLDELVAFLVADAPPDWRELRARLRETLPSYMIPTRYERVERLPRLVSNKIDRRALAAIPLTQAFDREAHAEPRSDAEQTLLAAARRVLPPGSIPLDADFFTELGGHSLLAARFVSALRETPRFAAVTLRDLYEARTLRALAARLDGKANPKPEARDFSFAPPPAWRRFLCGAAQALALPFILAVAAAQALGAFLAYRLGETMIERVAALFSVSVCVAAATLLISVGGKWLVIGRTKPGRYPLWGVYYFRWWLSQRLVGLTPSSYFQHSPLMRLYLRALGARVGEGAIAGALHMSAIDLVSIGAGASLGSKVILANARVEGDELVIGAIEIGEGATVGTSCVIEEDVVIGAGAALRDLTALSSGARVGAGEMRDGSPARGAGSASEAPPEPPAGAAPDRRRRKTAIFATLALLVPPLGQAPVFAALWTFDEFMGSPLALPLAAVALLLGSVGFLALFRRIFAPRAGAGTYSVWSPVYARKWAVELAAESTPPTLSALFSTIYMRPWQRLMGAKIGKGSELSINLAGRCDLVDIGENAFVADEASLAEPRFCNGWARLEAVTLGDRVFIGNDAVVPAGARLPDDALIGARSKPPCDRPVARGETWFGSPPFRLPAREALDSDAGWTYEPPLRRRAARAAYEALSVALPSALLLFLGSWWAEDIAPKLAGGDWRAVPTALLLDSLVVALAVTAAAVAVKWATMGRYGPRAKPMWSFWAMRAESGVVLYRGLARRLALDHLRGTPFLPWALRLLGARIGRGVYLDTTSMTEFDCVRIGGFCAINAQAALQTHLYEDRVLKVGCVTLGEGVTLGAGGSILYDAHVGDHARLGPLTVVMKGESIPARSAWTGAPAAPLTSPSDSRPGRAG